MTSSAVNTLSQGQLKVALCTHNEQANGGCQRAVFNVMLRDKKPKISDTEDVKQRGTKSLKIRRHLVRRRERHLGGLGVSRCPGEMERGWTAEVDPTVGGHGARLEESLCL